VTGDATFAAEPEVGLVIATLGGLLTAVTVTAVEVPVFPFESVTLTVSGKLPAVVGVQGAE
jgi:hypothetical protein